MDINLSQVNKMIILLSVVWICAFAKSDKSEYPSFSMAIQGGGNFATMFGSNIDALLSSACGDGTLKASINAEMSLTMQFNRILAVQTGIGGAGKGFRILLDYESGHLGKASLYYRRNISYLEVPLLLRSIFFAERGYNTGGAFHLFAGPLLGIVATARDKVYAKITEVDWAGNETKKTDHIDNVDLMESVVWEDTASHKVHYSFDDFYRRVDMSLVIGFAIERRFSVSGLFLECRYVQGLLNFNNLSEKAKKELEEYYSDDIQGEFSIYQLEAKCRTIYVSLGVNTYFKQYKNPSRKRSTYYPVQDY